MLTSSGSQKFSSRREKSLFRGRVETALARILAVIEGPAAPMLLPPFAAGAKRDTAFSIAAVDLQPKVLEDRTSACGSGLAAMPNRASYRPSILLLFGKIVASSAAFRRNNRLRPPAC